MGDGRRSSGGGGGASGGPGAVDKSTILTGKEEAEILGPLRQTITKEERDATRQYTGALHDPINEYLRGNRDTLGEPSRKVIDGLDSVFRKAPAAPKDITLFRGMRTTDSLVKQLESGGVLTDKAFVSTSRVQSEAFKGNIRMQIKVPKGTKILPMARNIGGITNQKEILLNRGTKMRIDSAVKKDGIWTVSATVIK